MPSAGQRGRTRSHRATRRTVIIESHVTEQPFSLMIRRHDGPQAWHHPDVPQFSSPRLDDDFLINCGCFLASNVATVETASIGDIRAARRAGVSSARCPSVNKSARPSYIVETRFSAFADAASGGELSNLFIHRAQNNFLTFIPKVPLHDDALGQAAGLLTLSTSYRNRCASQRVR